MRYKELLFILIKKNQYNLQKTTYKKGKIIYVFLSKIIGCIHWFII